MEQEMIVETGCLQRVAAIIEQEKFQKILVVTGRHFDQSKLDPITSKRADEVKCVVPPDGLLSLESISSYKNAASNCDVLIAIGGGRILDAAKLILYYSSSPAKPYFIAIPTTAGSGSEATPFAVVYSGLQKLSIADNKLLPDLVFLDAELLSSLPPQQRATSGIDALAQAIESIWNIHFTKVSVGYASEALQALTQELTLFVSGNDLKRNIKMLRAAYLAGKAIAITQTTGCHALSYYLTAQHGVPHGQAVAFFLPSFFLYNSKLSGQPGLQRIYEILEVGNASEACQAILQLMKECGLATHFSELKLKVDLDALIDSVNQERFANNPVPFDRKALKKLVLQYIV